MSNPFTSKHPVDPKYFADRNDVIKEFERLLSMSAERKEKPGPENMAIVGKWGVGKTSTIQKFQDICRKRKDYKILSSVITLKTRVGGDWNAFSKYVFNEFKRNYKPPAIKGYINKLKNIMNGWDVSSIELGITSGAKFDRKEPEFDLSIILTDLWGRVKEDVDMCLLMLDDVHFLDIALLQDIRNVFQELALGGANIMLVITGPEFIFERHDPAGSLRRFFDIVHLNLFDYESVEEAIRKPIEKEGLPLSISDEVIDRIYGITQGHPYFISFIMRDLVSYRGEGDIDAEFFEKSYQKIIGRLERDKFKVDLEELSEEQKKVIIKLAELDEEIVSPSDVDVARQHIKRLYEKNLLEKVGYGKYKIYHPLFRDFLRRCST